MCIRDSSSPAAAPAGEGEGEGAGGERSAPLHTAAPAAEEKEEKGLGAGFSVAVSVLAVFLALALFMVLPTAIVGGQGKLVELGRWRTPLEGLVKLCIFLGYMALVSRMKEIRRMFEYHGAEHKTIACYEHGEALTCLLYTSSTWEPVPMRLAPRTGVVIFPCSTR